MSVKKTANGRWRVRIYHQGKQVSTATFDRKTPADDWEREQKTALARRSWSNPRKGDIPLGDVIAQFLVERQGLVSQQTYDTDESNVRIHIPEAMKRMPIGSIDPARLRLFVNSLVRSKPKGTAKRIRESVTAVFAFAVTMNYIPHNTMHEAPLGRGDGREDATIHPFSEDEFQTALASFRDRHPHYADIVEFLRETGLRWGEMKALRVKNVSRSPFPAITVERSQADGYPEKQTKGRRVRKVPLMGAAADIAERHAAGRGRDDHLFRSPNGANLSGANFKRDLRWAETVGAHRIHDLRHTAATSWLNDGVNIKVISAWLGHSTTQQTVNRYAHFMGDDDHAAALAKVLAARDTRRSS